MSNCYSLNLLDSQRYQILMTHFYDYLHPGCKPEYLDGKTHFEQTAQRKLDVDLIIHTKDGYLGYEEKIISKPHPYFYAETESCTNPGRCSPGWMRTCEADYLIYAFEWSYGLEIHKIDFQQYKQWFWRELKERQRNFIPHRNGEQNQSQGVLVSTKEVHKKLTASRYFLTRHGICLEITIETDVEEFIARLMDMEGATV